MQILADGLAIDQAQLGNGGDSVLHETRSFDTGCGVDWQAGARMMMFDAGISGPSGTQRQKSYGQFGTTWDNLSLVSGLVQDFWLL